MQKIETNRGAPPGGHYSQAVVKDGTVWISGQLPIRADGSHCAGEPFDIQARQAMANLLAVLEAAGGKPEHLLKVTAYIKGVEHWPAFNRIYAEMMGDARPARAIVPVPELHHDLMAEVEGVAFIG